MWLTNPYEAEYIMRSRIPATRPAAGPSPRRVLADSLRRAWRALGEARVGWDSRIEHRASFR